MKKIKIASLLVLLGTTSLHAAGKEELYPGSVEGGAHSPVAQHGNPSSIEEEQKIVAAHASPHAESEQIRDLQKRLADALTERDAALRQNPEWIVMETRQYHQMMGDLEFAHRERDKARADLDAAWKRSNVAFDRVRDEELRHIQGMYESLVTHEEQIADFKSTKNSCMKRGGYEKSLPKLKGYIESKDVVFARIEIGTLVRGQLGELRRAYRQLDETQTYLDESYAHSEAESKKWFGHFMEQENELFKTRDALEHVSAERDEARAELERLRAQLEDKARAEEADAAS